MLLATTESRDFYFIFTKKRKEGIKRNPLISIVYELEIQHHTFKIIAVRINYKHFFYSRGHHRDPKVFIFHCFKTIITSLII